MKTTVSPELQVQAADWLGRRDAGLSPEDAAGFEAWLARDPAHFAAVAEVEAAWARVNRTREDGSAAAILARVAELDRIRRRRRSRWAGLAGAAVAAVAVLLVVGRLTWMAPVPAVETIVLRPELQVLADGSRVELNAGAEIAVDFTMERRGVRLLRGEALFTVAKNPARPFVVTAGAVEVTAVGTAFTVRHQTDAVGVLVTDGRVTVAQVVAPSETSPPVVSVGAGEQVVVSTNQAPVAARLEPEAIAAALAWRGMRVEFSGTSLGEAVALFNRQNRVQLGFADESLAEQKVSGIFWADDPEGFVRLLGGSFGIVGQAVGADRIVLRKSP